MHSALQIAPASDWLVGVRVCVVLCACTDKSGGNAVTVAMVALALEGLEVLGGVASLAALSSS